MAKYYAVSKTLILKRGIEIKRDHGTAYNSYGESFQVKEFWIRENVNQTDMEDLLQREQIL
jgi:hypothetical protein